MLEQINWKEGLDQAGLEKEWAKEYLDTSDVVKPAGPDQKKITREYLKGK